ncbi:MAG TPA: choice-of-anchor G family protein [Jatrophihabitantaceae bacterium]|nr:choice-of-anchor G family protein [Jatrophihabitantaceae bacterium]
MTSASDASGPIAGSRRRRLGGRVIAASVVTTLTVAGVAFAGSQSAGAASAPLAQSVGRFVDGSLGGKPIQTIADVHDARALAPGTQSQQNPLDVTLLSKLNLNLTNDLKLPQLLGINLGAANQVAVAHNDGFSYGASGAVSNSGGVSVGGNDNAFPADATINLSASGIAGNGNVPVPGGGAADALGGVHVTIGAVSALAQTPAGVGQPGSTNYGVAGLNIVAASPLLAKLLTSVGGVLGKVITALNPLLKLAPACPVLNGTLPDLSLENGAITLSASTGGLTIDLEKLLQNLNLDLNHLPANTDLIDLLINYLSSPSGLAAGLSNLINGLFTGPNGLKAQLDACAPAGVKGGIDTLFNALGQLQSPLSKLLGGLKLPGGGSALAPLGTVLKKLVDIGINVQPNGAAGTFKSALAATPDQATPVVPGQTIVRAIEVDLVGDPLAVVALANAAAGPSSGTIVTPPPTTAIPCATATTCAPPTKVPAGQGSPSNPTPLILLLAGLFLASGGAVAFKLRGRYSA